VLYQTGLDLLAFADHCTKGLGKQWLRTKLSPLRLHLRGWPHRIASWVNHRPTSIVFPKAKIWLLPDLEQHHLRRPHIAHELAHVLDNRLAERRLPSTIFGGGPADQLLRDLGGKPRGLRFANGVDSLDPELHWTANTGYGNRSSAEYFAEAFTWSIYDPTQLPSPALLEWVEKELFRW